MKVLGFARREKPSAARIWLGISGICTVAILLMLMSLSFGSSQVKAEWPRSAAKGLPYEALATTQFVDGPKDGEVTIGGSQADRQLLAKESAPLSQNLPASAGAVKETGAQAVIDPPASTAAIPSDIRGLVLEFWQNMRKNLFKPLLLFFYMGFLISLLRIEFEFPQAIHQGLTMYLLIAIGWHGGEELAVLSGPILTQAMGFIVVGFATNLFIGILAYVLLRSFVPSLRKIDSATVAAYYGSDSAGTFVTCLGVLQAARIAYAAYMPVMLAVMEIPGCLVGLYLVSRLRKKGMDPQGNMPGEPDYDPGAIPAELLQRQDYLSPADPQYKALQVEKQMALEQGAEDLEEPSSSLPLSKLAREVFLNPGLFLLFGGIVIGFISRLQGYNVVAPDDTLFVTLFQGMLCLFLLEMGTTAAKRLKDLRSASWRFIVFALAVPNLFAVFGMTMCCVFSHTIGMSFQLGTYVLFAVLCAAASYIAVPAIQRLAIPEASPSLPLAASLGLTFSYNVTIGIPLYIVIAEQFLLTFPVHG